MEYINRLIKLGLAYETSTAIYVLFANHLDALEQVISLREGEQV